MPATRGTEPAGTDRPASDGGSTRSRAAARVACADSSSFSSRSRDGEPGRALARLSACERHDGDVPDRPAIAGIERDGGKQRALPVAERPRGLEEPGPVRVRPRPPEDLVGDLTERMTPERQARRALAGEELLEDRPVPRERRGVRPEPVGNGELGD